MINNRPAVLLVESKRLTFTRHVLQRTDIDVAMLRIDSSVIKVNEAESIVPTFYLNPKLTLAKEALRFKAWAKSLRFELEYFCNPNEALQHTAQAFAKHIGLPFLNEVQVNVVRNKMAMKEFYNRNNIPCAKFAKVEKPSDIEEFANKYGFPVIVKPVDSDSCIDTFKVDSLPEVPELTENHQWMVENYIKAREYQICAIVANGEVLDAYVAKNPAPIIEVFDGAINANITLAPSEVKPIDPVAIMQKITTALDLRCGYLHGEFFIKGDGEFVMSEVAARLSGCEVPLNHAYAYGFDFLNAVMDTYIGRTPVLQYTQDRAVGDLLLPAKKGKITYISSRETLLGLDGVIDCTLNFSEGDVIIPRRASGFCSGYLQVEGRNSQEVEDRMHEILKIFKLEVE